MSLPQSGKYHYIKLFIGLGYLPQIGSIRPLYEFWVFGLWNRPGDHFSIKVSATVKSMVATQINNYACYYPACGKTFSTKFNLRRHINVSHLDIRAYSCEVCQKHFASKQNLKEHFFIHTGERPFECPVDKCGRRFRQASQLAFHKKLHFRKAAFRPWTGGNLLSLLSYAIEENFVSVCEAFKAISLPELCEERKKKGSKLPIAAGLLAF